MREDLPEGPVPSPVVDRAPGSLNSERFGTKKKLDFLRNGTSVVWVGLGKISEKGHPVCDCRSPCILRAPHREIPARPLDPPLIIRTPEPRTENRGSASLYLYYSILLYDGALPLSNLSLLATQKEAEPGAARPLLALTAHRILAFGLLRRRRVSCSPAVRDKSPKRRRRSCCRARAGAGEPTRS